MKDKNAVYLAHSMKNKIIEHFGDKNGEEIISKIESTNKIELRMTFIDISKVKPGHIEFTSVSKDGSARGKEQHMKISKFINKFVDIESEKYKDSMKSLHSDLSSFDYYIEIGDSVGDFIEAYASRNYANESGRLLNSCMRSERMEKGIVFYGKEENIKIAILRKKGDSLIYGRAILWDKIITEKAHKQIKAMDTIYACTSRYHLFNKYAKDNGYVHCNEIFDDAHVVISKSHDYLPHFDTFYNVTVRPTSQTNLLSNFERKNLNPYEYSFGSAYGNVVNIREVFICKHCGANFCLPDEDMDSDYCDNCIEHVVNVVDEDGSEFQVHESRAYYCNHCDERHPITVEESSFTISSLDEYSDYYDGISFRVCKNGIKKLLKQDNFTENKNGGINYIMPGADLSYSDIMKMIKGEI